MTALSAEQLATFEERGHLRLHEAFPREVALRLQDHMWAELREGFAIDRDDRGTWFQPRRSLRRAKWDPHQVGIAAPRLVDAIGTLLGAVRWRLPSNWGAVLVTFPDSSGGDWVLPCSGWHYDFDLRENADRVCGLQVFTFFSTVEPRGGGTLIVEGSHRVLRRFAENLSADDWQADHRRLRNRFLRHRPWLEALSGAIPEPKNRIERFMREPHDVRGVPVRVTELTGEPGDAVVCHPLMLHVAASNRSDRPRFMRSQRICGEVDG